MHTFQINTTVGDIVAQHPALSRVFEKAGIDYCCGGKKTLDEACGTQGLNPNTLLAELEESVSTMETPTLDVIAMSLTDLADHIEQTHHIYLRSELSRLDALTEKVAYVHGENDSRLFEIRETFLAMLDALAHFETDMHQHIHKENNVLFPRALKMESEKRK